MRDILRLSLPLTLWLAGFSAVYGLHGLTCHGGWPGGRALLLAAALGALGLQGMALVILRSRRFASPSGFVRRISLTLATAAIVATGWSLAPILTTSACPPGG